MQITNRGPLTLNLSPCFLSPAVKFLQCMKMFLSAPRLAARAGVTSTATGTLTGGELPSIWSALTEESRCYIYIMNVFIPYSVTCVFSFTRCLAVCHTAKLLILYLRYTAEVWIELKMFKLHYIIGVSGPFRQCWCGKVRVWISLGWLNQSSHADILGGCHSKALSSCCRSISY